VRARLRWLAAGLACCAAGGLAQSGRTLDLKYRSVTEGTVTSLREVRAGGSGPTLAAKPVGSESDLDQGPLVGAVVYLPLGGSTSDKSWRFGAAGTPEMQAWLAESSREVLVAMDDGEKRTFRPSRPERFQPGQRVTVRSGELEPLSGARGGG
jgi:hypothetical protein